MKKTMLFLVLIIMFSCAKRTKGDENLKVNYNLSGTIKSCSGNPIIGATFILDTYEGVESQSNDQGEWSLFANDVVACANNICKVIITFLDNEIIVSKQFNISISSFETNDDITYTKSNISKLYNISEEGNYTTNCEEIIIND